MVISSVAGQPDRQLAFQSIQETIDDLVSRYRDGKIELDPPFQRDSVWKLRDRQKLIDSILNNYPLPAIFLYETHDRAGNVIYQVIDGKQRLESIFMFVGEMQGKFEVKRDDFEEERWVDYRNLVRRGLQRLLNQYRMQVIQVTGEPSSIWDLFVRINSTGKALTSAEKLKAKYFRSRFLKTAQKLSRKWRKWFLSAGVFSASHVNRMRDVEFMCELMLSCHSGEPIYKKSVLDKAFDEKAIDGRSLERITRETNSALRRVRRLFPKIRETRFNKVSDFYTLVVLVQSFEREKLVLVDKRRNSVAWSFLREFGKEVDRLSQRLKDITSADIKDDTYREYLLTVRERSDQLDQRKRREAILRQLLGSLFEKKDEQRGFSSLQRRIVWNSKSKPRCSVRGCRSKLTFNNFTVDHQLAWARGGKTQLSNAALMCHRHNSQLGMKG